MINTQLRLAILGYGTECSKKNAQMASVIGRLAGRNEISLIAGNVTSTFGYAFKAAKEFKVANICVIEKHKPHTNAHDATEIYHTPDTFSKHAQIAQMADAAILIGGGPGSQLLLNHFIKNKKTVIAIKGSGGLADGKLKKKVLIAQNATEAFKMLFHSKKVIHIESSIGKFEMEYNHLALSKLQSIEEVDTDKLNKKDMFVKQFGKYEQGKLQEFTGRIHLIGTDFQKKVWRALLDIPYGKTMEYGEMAELIGETNSQGVIAKVAMQNPIQVIIPDHRLSLKDGSFSKKKEGLELQSRLLDLENKQTKLRLF